jgi:hypothetical protein
VRILAFRTRNHVCNHSIRHSALGRAHSLHRRQPQTASTLHQKAGSLGKVQRCWPSGEKRTAAALSHPDGTGLLERLAICIEHELYHGGDHRAAAAAVVRDVDLKYIGVPAVPGCEQGFDVGRIADRLAELSDYVTQGPEVVRREFTMRVPAERYRDADLVLSTAASLLRGGVATPKAIKTSQRMPEGADLRDGKCWWGDGGNDDYVPSWRFCMNPGQPRFTQWLPWWAMAMPEAS